jgi:DNA-binding CsgD family transcriptional regulator
MRYSAAIAHIRQLCCLGLGGQVIMPALLQALHSVIPSAANVFMWTDESGEVTNVCFEDPTPPEMVALYLAELFDKRVDEVTSESTRALRGVVNFEPAIGEAFYRSDLYNLVYRPSDRYAALRAIIRENGRPLGALVLCRGSHDPPFTEREEKNLSNLTGYLAHGLKSSRDIRGPFADGGESGLIVLDSQNKLAYGSANGRRLLLLAAHPLIPPGSIGPRDDTVLTPAIAQLCENLRSVFTGRDAPVPRWSHQNPWGQFVFRAYPLQPGQESANQLMGITVEHQEPLPLRMMRSMQAFALSPKQKEICLLLSYGYSHGTIGKRLNISQHTVSDHVQKIYAKLGVNNRETLLSKLY